MKTTLHQFIAALAVLAFAPVAFALTFTGSYSENFDSMGTAGTAPPTGWTVKTGDGGANSTWTSSIPANGTLSVQSMVNTATALTAITTPTTANNNGYNAALDAAHTSDRVLSTSPTQVTGSALELSLSNNTGGPISSVNLSYDIVRYSAVSSANELPGYEIFYSLNGTTWANVAALNPTTAGPGGVIVPNTAGVTSVSNAPVTLSSDWVNGSTILIRWVDDNAAQTSPDQIIGLNNVNVVAPEPASLAVLSAVGLLLLAPRRRKA